MAIPVLMILFVAGSIYLPGLFVKAPEYNFMYSVSDYSYNGVDQYIVEKGQVAKPVIAEPAGSKPIGQEKLFIYDIGKNQSSEISFDAAQKIVLNTASLSPDGFEVSYGNYGNGFFPFFFSSGTDYNTIYIKGHNISKKLNIQMGGTYYNFRFLGWINK